MSFKFELHAHTQEVSPCGRLAATRLVDLYHRAGYSGLVITDHFTATIPAFAGSDWEKNIEQYLTGYRKAARHAERYNLTVLMGIELTLSSERQTPYNNDFLIYGLNEQFLLENPFLYERDLKKVKELVHARGGLIFQAHPFRSKCRVVDPALVDGVETFNGNPRQTSNNNLTDEFAEANGLLKISGSDAHQITDIGIGGIQIGTMPRSNPDLVKILKRQPELITVDAFTTANAV